MSPERAASNALLKLWCPRITGQVLSLGSGSDLDGAGQTYRSYFAHAASYTTSDIDPGADLQLNIMAMPTIPSESVDCLFVSGVLEHVEDFHAALRECARVLKPGGVLLLGVPFKQKLHRIPRDYWRFTEFGIQQMLKDAFRIETLQVLGEPSFPGTYWVRAYKR